MIAERVFREYDIRGVADSELSPAFARALGSALVELIRQKGGQPRWLSVGRDVRLSSSELAQAVINGITSTGVHVHDLGICPTPLQYFSLFQLPTDGGVMVTGSHNPPEYNGFKISVGKETIHGLDIQRLKGIILGGRDRSVREPGRVEPYDIGGDYLRFMEQHFGYLRNPCFGKPRVVVDAGNGTAGLIVPGLLEAVGCEVVPLYCEPDGRFPNHHPDPTVVDNIRVLIEETRRTKADMGIGYDGDADRIGVVDSAGSIVWGDQLMIVLSRAILSVWPGARIIGDVKCSQRMFDEIERSGGMPIMWKTGHSLIKRKMRDEGAILAGEFSGHIFISDRYYGYDDAIYVTLRLVEIMKTTCKGIRELLADQPRLWCTPEIRMGCPDELKRSVVARVVQRLEGFARTGSGPLKIKSVTTIDGVRIVFDKGWGLVRMSNTQPVIVMRTEAEDQESLNHYQSSLESEVKQAMEDSISA